MIRILKSYAAETCVDYISLHLVHASKRVKYDDTLDDYNLNDNDILHIFHEQNTGKEELYSNINSNQSKMFEKIEWQLSLLLHHP